MCSGRGLEEVRVYDADLLTFAPCNWNVAAADATCQIWVWGMAGVFDLATYFQIWGGKA
jgi:hypothetical protein